MQMPPKGLVVDTILNKWMYPVFIQEPAVVRRRLLAPYSDDWEKVCVGVTGQVVTITEYLYAEKFKDILGMVEELLRKKDLPMYRRDPERLKVYVEAATKKIIERALRD
jgi:hypothetical protein